MTNEVWVQMVQYRTHLCAFFGILNNIIWFPETHCLQVAQELQLLLYLPVDGSINVCICRC